VTTFQAWGLAHKGKATSDVVFNVDDPPEAYTNPTAHDKIRTYTQGVREVHGPDYDPTSQPIDAEVVMRVGAGKQHGRYLIADGSISSSRRLSQIRASSSSGSPSSIRPRSNTTQGIVAALQVICLAFVVL